ncbi:light-regulated protein, chloroplastic [Macadamia integrifolia]|uniref:light-regulated protein, chloroplastic n=1 Tax=Macadamia integrifolia TaxID=60698 RepID=UPI001C4FB7F4|nr:light-regulated protein, chloroplastic [Macadamia integrifolia]
MAALCFATSFPILTPTKISVATLPRSSPKILPLLESAQASRCPSIKAASSTDPSAVDYSSTISVFPAEACETIGGEACAAEMYPEAKIKTEDGNGVARTVPEMVDRDYVEYNEPKTVFPGEACDDLGGEFCEPDYQKGVY